MALRLNFMKASLSSLTRPYSSTLIVEQHGGDCKGGTMTATTTTTTISFCSVEMLQDDGIWIVQRIYPRRPGDRINIMQHISKRIHKFRIAELPLSLAISAHVLTYRRVLVRAATTTSKS